jgi:hypothetical protein
LNLPKIIGFAKNKALNQRRGVTFETPLR